jgi:hypothetical protein
MWRDVQIVAARSVISEGSNAAGYCYRSSFSGASVTFFGHSAP